MYRLYRLSRFNFNFLHSRNFCCIRKIANVNAFRSPTQNSSTSPIQGNSLNSYCRLPQKNVSIDFPLRHHSFSTGSFHLFEDDLRELKTGEEVLSFFSSQSSTSNLNLQQLLKLFQAILRLPAVGFKTKSNSPERQSRSNEATTVGENVTVSSKKKANDSSLSSISPQLHENAVVATGYGRGKQIIWKDERFSKLIEEMGKLVESAENRILSILCLNLASVRYPVEAVQVLIKKLAGIMLQKENMLLAKQLCGFALGFSSMTYRDRHVSDFIRLESLKILDTFQPGDLYVLLESMRRWSISNRELTDTVIEKMLDVIDQYNAEDVANTLNLLANAAIVRGVLIRRLATLAMDNLNAFQPRQLVSTFQALSRLRFISTENAGALCDAIMNSVDTLSDEEVARVLVSICLSPFENESTVRILLKRFSDKPPPTSIQTLSKVLYAICFYELYDMSNFLKQGLEYCFKWPAAGQREILARMMEIVRNVEIELPEYAVAVPPAWRAAIEEFEHAQMTRSETSRILKELLLVLDSLALKTKLHFQTNQQAGPYRVDLLDPSSKVCCNIDWISRFTPTNLQHRNLSKLGYQSVSISFWLWRRYRTEEEQRGFLLKNLQKIGIH